MKLEIRNLQSSATYEIDPEGAILGREGSKADIVLRDQAVSKKHAKIYEKNGRWYLEDLASSNGTFFDNRRITEPVILTPGAVFALSENQFEVVQIITNGRADGKSGLSLEVNGQERPFRESLDELPPLGMTPGDGVDDRKRQRSPKSNQAVRGQLQAATNDIQGEGSLAEVKGASYFFVAVPKAIAYYLAAIPLMALNPIGTVRKGIQDQKFPAMGPFPLIGYALPANVFTSLLGIVSAAIASLIAGAFVLPLMPLVVGVAVAVVVSVVTGFIFHPVFGWIIRFLKGESDDRSRSNFFIAIYTATALVAIPSAAATLLASVRLPFINAVPVVITMLASLISFYAFYSWMKHFNVVAWFQKVLLVLGILLVASTGIGVVQQVLAGIDALGTDGQAALAGVGSANLTPEQAKLVEEAQKAAALALEGKGELGAGEQESIKKTLDAAMKQKADMEAAMGKTPDTEKGEKAEKGPKSGGEEAAAAREKTGDVEGAADRAQEKAKPGASGDREREESSSTPAHVGAPARAKPDPRQESRGVALDTPDAAAVLAALASALKRQDAGLPAVGKRSPFLEFVERRDAIEKAVFENPTLLDDDKTRDLYERLWRKTFEVRAQWSKKKIKDPAAQKVNDRRKDAAVWKATEKMVGELHARIFR